jgi:hypothetical protein
MPRPIRRDGVDSFNQEQIDVIEKAIDRAWSVIKYTDNVRPENEAQKLLALCVMAEARTGEEEYVALVNRSIVRFRAQRARLLSESRRRHA